MTNIISLGSLRGNRCRLWSFGCWLVGPVEIVAFDSGRHIGRGLPQIVGKLGIILVVAILESFAADDVGDRRDKLGFVAARRRDAR